MTQHQCLKCHATVDLPDGHTLNVCPQCGAIQAKVAAAVRKVAPTPGPHPVVAAPPLPSVATRRSPRFDVGSAATGLLAGLVLLGFPLSLIVGFASLRNAGSGMIYGWVFAGIIGLALGVTASRPAKAIRRVLLTGAVLILTLPLVTCVGSASMFTGGTAAQATGGLIGAGIGSLFVGFFAFFGACAYLVAGLLIGRDRPEDSVAQSVSVTPNRTAKWAIVGAVALVVALGAVVNRYAELKAQTATLVATAASADNEFASADKLCGVLKKMDGIARCSTSGERTVTVVMNAANPQELCIGMTTLTTATMRNNGAPPLTGWALVIVSPLNTDTPLARCMFS